MIETITPQNLSFHEEDLNMTFCFDILEYTLWKKVVNSQTMVDGQWIKYFFQYRKTVPLHLSH